MKTLQMLDAMTRTELANFLEDQPESNPANIRKLTRKEMLAQVVQIHKDLGQFKDEAAEKAIEAEVREKATRPDKPAKDPKPCACGCGGFTKGGTWLPGHDAKHASSLRGNPNAPKACFCGCGEFTKGGTFRPGHDARYYSQLHKSAGIGLDIKQPHVTKEAFMPDTLNPNKWALIGSKEVVAA